MRLDRRQYLVRSHFDCIEIKSNISAENLHNKSGFPEQLGKISLYSEDILKVVLQYIVCKINLKKLRKA